MEFVCRDFPQFGVQLIPPSSPDYEPLLEEIRRRVDKPTKGSPPVLDLTRPRFLEEDRATSAILVNRGAHGIAAIQQVWTFQHTDGRTFTRSFGPGANPVLLPFGLPEEQLKLYRYWHVILPGSKRYLNANGQIAGDNRDVRPPQPDELWSGGIGMGGGGGGGYSYPVPLQKVTLTLDGLFFDDGGFLGPDRKGLWEQVVVNVELFLELAALAKQMRHKSASTQAIFEEIHTITGPLTDPLPPSQRGGAREEALRKLVLLIRAFRQKLGDDRAVEMVASWADQPLPHFRRL
ncbi:MAG TPA: hypothetical protein VMT15_13740 [Bryobacteraceae bacterium]|nr:hypothetical protein [Bryobacteraceae bacterium]